MAGLEEIDALFDPQIVESLKLQSPVICKIWKGGNSYETITLDSLYPFDTLDTLKQSIALLKKEDNRYLPQYLFVGIATDDTRYAPLEYTWYPPGIQDAERAIYLPSPATAMTSPVDAFVVRGGAKPALVLNPRGRTMIEDVFKGAIPELIVFPFHHVEPLFKGAKPIGEGDWYQRFYPYYPQLSRDPIVSNEEKAFAKVFKKYLTERRGYLRKIDRLLESGSPLPTLTVTGVNQLRLRIQMPSSTFKNCQTLFYETSVYKLVPYMRIVPKEGTPITKVLVSGILPIPDMDNPEVISQWAKEPTPTIGHDFLMLKYVHRPATSLVCPLYGTLRIFHDGTADVTVQSPKGIRKLDPFTDFNKFGALLQSVTKGLPLDLSRIELGEAALIFKWSADRESTHFTKSILKKRLPFFSPFFQELAPLKDTLLSLRYKMVSQYASENSIFAFLTQYAESKKLDGLEPTSAMIGRLQEEFQMSEADARSNINQWLERGGTLSIVVPEENEFMESFNPGIDIHIYGAYPEYTIHVHRIDSYRTLQRLYTILCILFSEDDERRFTESEGAATAFSAIEATVEKAGVHEEVVARKDALVQKEGKSTASGAVGVVEEDSSDEDSSDEEGGLLLESMMVKSKPTAAAPAPVAPAPVQDKKKALVVRNEKQADIDPRQWFIKKLKGADPDVYEYKSTVKGSTYATHCQAVDDRIPAVLTRAQYDYMIDVYDEEISAGDLFFNVYPFTKKGDEKEAGKGGIKGDATQITVSRYSSDPKKDIYLFCPALFCLRDNIMVLEDDFNSDKDRKGNPKPRLTCPFCKGTLMSRNKIIKGATVYRRKAKKLSTPKPHLFMGFVGKLEESTNPKGLALPCCFTKVQSLGLRISEPEFRDFAALTISSDKGRVLDLVEGEDTDADSDADTEAKAVKPAAPTISYFIEFNRLHTAYILDANKHPLGPGQVAILPEPLENYFQQMSSTFVTRTSIQQNLKSKGQGFLRIGTEAGPTVSKCDSQPKHTEALLGVLAPLLFKNSIQEVKQLLLTAVQGPAGVQLFVNANFGNLVNEFYVPSDPDLVPERTAETLTDKPKMGITNALKSWSRDHLRISVNEKNHYAVRRIYKSYNRFVAFLKDPTQRKDLRHLSTFLTEPGLLTSNVNGLQLVVLEWSPGQESVVVRCSPYGFSKDRHKENDFAFVWRDATGFYELLLYTKNVPASDGNGAKHITTHRWEYADKYSAEDGWPRIVKDRINEYMKKCKSQYTSLFTSQMGIDSSTLVPLSVALTTEITVTYKDGSTKDIVPYGLVRDSYNHAVFVLYSQSRKEAGPMVAMPIADDGSIPQFQQLYLDIEDVNYAPANEAIAFYKNYLTPTFASYPDYEVKRIIKKKKAVNGLQLSNGIFIPAGDVPAGTDLSAYPETSRSVDEWDLNRQLTGSCGTSPDLTDTTQKRLDELYQYFRYMVSNWIASEDAGSEVRDAIQEIVFNTKLPDYEKRKRLEILCGNFTRGEDEETGWLGWMQPAEEDWDLPTGLLRKDCRVLEEADCTGACIWRVGNSGKGSCALHVDATTKLRSTEPTTVNTRILFSRRIIDELIRFPKRRLELLQKSVSEMSLITEPIRDGDQYIIPERGMSWLALLRLDWRPPEKEMPLFYEEMTKRKEETEETEELEELEESEEMARSGSPEGLPKELVALVGTKTPYQLQIAEGGLKDIIPILKSSLEELGAEAADTVLRKEGLQAYVDRRKISVGIVNLTRGVPAVEFLKATGIQNPKNAVILVFRKGQIGFLTDKPNISTVAVSGLDGTLLEAWVAEKKAAVAPVPVPRKASGLLRMAPVVSNEEAEEAVETVKTIPATRPSSGLSKKPVATAVTEPTTQPSSGLSKKPVATAIVEPPKKSSSGLSKKPVTAATVATEPVVSESIPIEPTTRLSSGLSRKPVTTAATTAVPESIPVEPSKKPSSGLSRKPVTTSTVTAPVEPPKKSSSGLSKKPGTKSTDTVPESTIKTVVVNSKLRRANSTKLVNVIPTSSLSVIPEATVEQSQTVSEVSVPPPAAPKVSVPPPTIKVSASPDSESESPSPTESNASAKTPELNLGSNNNNSSSGNTGSGNTTSGNTGSGNTARSFFPVTINSIKKPSVI